MKQPLRRLIQTDTCVGLVHVGDDLFGIRQNNQMLGQESQRVHDQVFLRKPDRPGLGNAKLGANHSDIYIREFVWIANRLCASCTRNLGNGGANHKVAMPTSG
jgi:hypothetical protein